GGWCSRSDRAGTKMSRCTSTRLGSSVGSRSWPRRISCVWWASTRSRRVEMTATLALAGDTMLGRGVAQALAADPYAPLVAEEVAACIASSDAFVLNLECCISDRGSRFPEP